jgi:ribosomal protein L12E/L44/L45/RPP1/RPP2
MLKKIATIIAASAFALAVYAPAASACPGHDKGKIADKKKDGDSKKSAEAEKKEDTKNEKKEDEGKKVSRK